MITINIEDIIQEIRLYGNLWDMDMTQTSKYISNHSWIFHTCQYNHKNKIKLKVKRTTILPGRTNDQSIMFIALSFYQDQSTLQSINRICMLHNIYHLSDITCADGRSINAMYTKSKQHLAHRNTDHWPLKHHLIPKDYTHWRAFLQLIYTFDSLKLPTPLTN